MYKVSTSSMRITPDKVKKDNSNIWQYSPELFSALRKEKFSKSDPEAYIAYRDAVGDLALSSPYDDVDLQMDLAVFKKSLNKSDLRLFNLMLLGMTQSEIAGVVGISQPTVSIKLKKLREQFKEFYYE